MTTVQEGKVSRQKAGGKRQKSSKSRVAPREVPRETGKTARGNEADIRLAERLFRERKEKGEASGLITERLCVG